MALVPERVLVMRGVRGRKKLTDKQKDVICGRKIKLIREDDNNQCCIIIYLHKKKKV